jgi:hypothetical protein
VRSFLLPLGLLAASACSALTLVETRLNILPETGLAGRGLLAEHVWLLGRETFPEVSTWPFVGLFASAYRVTSDGPTPEGTALDFGFSSGFVGKHDAGGAFGFFNGRFGASYLLETPTGRKEGFQDEGINNVSFEASGGYTFSGWGRFHPSLEIFLGTHMWAGARLGASIPLIRRLPSTPPDSGADVSPKSPRFHAMAGVVLTAEGVFIPVLGDKWFGGSLDVAATVARPSPDRDILVGTRVLGAAARPGDIFTEGRPRFVSGILTVAFQDFKSLGGTLGYRVTTGWRYYERYHDHWQDWDHTAPLFSVALMARTESGFYPFLDMGLFEFSPPTVGIGKDF